MPAGIGYPPFGGQPPNPQPEARNGPQSGGFTEALRQPEVQAALLQFGINMLQPTYSGLGGQLGKSLGQAGAAAGRASAQRAQRASAASAAEMEERKFGLASRRTKAVEERERRLGRKGGSLQSMFTKPKSFQQFLADQAENDALYDPEGRTPSELQLDPDYRQRLLQLWQETAGIGTGGGATTPSSEASTPTKLPEGMTPEAALQEAKQAVLRGAPLDAVKQRLQAMGIDASGL